MTATTKSFTAILDAAIAAGKPVDTVLMTAIRDSLQNLHERLGGSYASNVMDHNHDGIGSAKIQVGPNMLRGGDFENGLTGWTATQYTGGTVAASTQDADGTSAVQITSTVLANGGGDILSNEFMVCVGGACYNWSVNSWASVANVSAKLEAVFYDQAQSQISTTVLMANNGSATANTRYGGQFTAPATARYVRFRATGGVPNVGSATGTIYFDAAYCTGPVPYVRQPAFPYYVSPGPVTDGSGGWVEALNSYMNYSGTYRVAFTLATSNGAQPSYGRIYKNGVAYGTSQTTTSTTGQEFAENLAFAQGDTVQVFICSYTGGGPTATGKNLGFGATGSAASDLNVATPLAVGLR